MFQALLAAVPAAASAIGSGLASAGSAAMSGLGAIGGGLATAGSWLGENALAGTQAFGNIAKNALLGTNSVASSATPAATGAAETASGAAETAAGAAEAAPQSSTWQDIAAKALRGTMSGGFNAASDLSKQQQKRQQMPSVTFSSSAPQASPTNSMSSSGAQQTGRQPLISGSNAGDKYRF